MIRQHTYQQSPEPTMPDAPRDWPTDPATRWLVKQYTGPSKNIYARWRDPGVLSFPLGENFDAIVVTLHLGRAVVEALRSSDLLVGPVVVDQRSAHATFLVPAGTAGTWTHPLTVAHGVGESFFCPEPSKVACRRGWLVNPDQAGVLTDPDQLLTALESAGEELIDKQLITGSGGR
ncbi:MULTISPECIES: hypothetical protein [Streptacidiphilus]|uniref:DNA primase/polymerase bifunctional N-terminal domain-containing protein n=1 Tax=Streptacidiphilus cavernicola TaxID=3342716 RepID=A0ABV6UYS1_9ACTN|nr:hypothetical protein [Streptacidiphilus jeojiense]